MRSKLTARGWIGLTVGLIAAGVYLAMVASAAPAQTPAQEPAAAPSFDPSETIDVEVAVAFPFDI